jgi:hypothetical protein
LTKEGSTYEIDSEGHIRNVDTGLYVRHSYWVLYEEPLGQPEYDFKWTIEDSGLICNDYDGVYYAVPDGEYLKIQKEDMFGWTIINENSAEVPAEVPAEEEEDDVPVSRASALIEEALNASASCGCDCGCGPDCQGCECECGCPKLPAQPTSV